MNRAVMLRTDAGTELLANVKSLTKDDTDMCAASPSSAYLSDTDMDGMCSDRTGESG